MVRKYVRKTIRNSWADLQLELAKDSVRIHGQPINKTAAEFNIPRSTLQKKIANDEGKSTGM